jgi:hypothetical protein
MASLQPWVRKSLDVLFWLAMAVVVPLAPVSLFLAWFGFGACITSEPEKVFGVSGYDFDISETDCDTLAKDAAISVFAAKSGHAKKTLVFKYDPGDSSQDGTWPVIASVDGRTVRISVDRVSSLFLRREELDGLAIDYRIGKIEYPD